MEENMNILAEQHRQKLLYKNQAIELDKKVNDLESFKKEQMELNE